MSEIQSKENYLSGVGVGKRAKNGTMKTLVFCSLLFTLFLRNVSLTKLQ